MREKRVRGRRIKDCSHVVGVPLISVKGIQEHKIKNKLQRKRPMITEFYH